MYSSLIFSQPAVSEKFLSHSWLDQNNKKFNFKSIDSGIYAVAVAYTKCSSVCPMVSRQIAAIRSDLRDKNIDLPVFFISIDPKNDNFKRRKAFLNKLDAVNDWKFLTSDIVKTRALVAELGMGFSDPMGNKHAMHTMTLALINSKGEILTVIPVLTDNTAAAIEKIMALMPKNRL